MDATSSEVFEIFWEPGMAAFTARTSDETKANMKVEKPPGFSGALVWNTRFWEVSASGREWRPDDAVVTGLLRRWDRDTKTLLVLRVEHLQEWLDQHL